MTKTAGTLLTPALVTCASEGPVPAGEGRVEVVRDAVLAWEGGEVVYAGPRGGWRGPVQEETAGAVVPGFVDCHTHLPFHGWRDDEFEARLAGRSYRDLHGEGGIERSARMLAEAGDEEVLAFSMDLAGEMLRHGTTGLELKTGYGLSVERELRQARLARELAERVPQTAVVTLLVCHAVPEGMVREAWVRRACEELIPQAAADGLADAVDVYVEDIAFTTEDLERVAEAAGASGLPLRVHADQLGNSGAAVAAAGLGARTADHLNHAGPEGARALASSGTIAVLLPGSTLLMRAAPPPVEELVASGTALALATDCNPGTSAVASMPEVIALACSLYGLSPGDALAASTLNSAHALGLADRLGALRPGLRADFVVLDHPEVRSIPYRPGHNPVARVFVGGREL